MILKILTLAAITLSLSACVSSETSTLDKIKQEGKIVIGVKTDYKPYGFIDEKGNNAGLEIDIARYVTKQILGNETKVEFKPVVAKNRIELLQQGQVDLVIATMTITDERKKKIDFSNPYYSAGTGFLTRKDSNIKDWAELKGKKVCGIQGSFYNKELEEMGLDMVNFPGTAEAYKALKDGRCVGFAFDNTAIAGKLLEPEWSQEWHQTLPVILPKPWGMGIRKGDSKLLETVNQAILKMKAEAFILNGEKKWQVAPKTSSTQAQN